MCISSQLDFLSRISFLSTWDVTQPQHLNVFQTKSDVFLFDPFSILFFPPQTKVLIYLLLNQPTSAEAQRQRGKTLFS